MSPILIEDDIVIIKKQNDFETGDIVVAIVNGNEATIKKVEKVIIVFYCNLLIIIMIHLYLLMIK